MDLFRTVDMLTGQHAEAIKTCDRRIAVLNRQLVDEGLTVRFLKGLRIGTSIPDSSRWEACGRWMFVRKLELEVAQETVNIRELECLVIPEILESQERWEPTPGRDDGSMSEVIYTPDMLAQEIVAKVADVTIGGWDDILTVPCDVCGTSSPLVCERHEDYRSDMLDISVGILCPHCLRFTETAGMLGNVGAVQLLVAKK